MKIRQTLDKNPKKCVILCRLGSILTKPGSMMSEHKESPKDVQSSFGAHTYWQHCAKNEPWEIGPWGNALNNRSQWSSAKMSYLLHKEGKGWQMSHDQVKWQNWRYVVVSHMVIDERCAKLKGSPGQKHSCNLITFGSVVFCDVIIKNWVCRGFWDFRAHIEQERFECRRIGNHECAWEADKRHIGKWWSANEWGSNDARQRFGSFRDSTAFLKQFYMSE